MKFLDSLTPVQARRLVIIALIGFWAFALSVLNAII
jgi:hypothetical protein